MVTTGRELKDSGSYTAWKSDYAMSRKQKNRESNIALKAAERNEFVKIARDQADCYITDAKNRQEQSARLYSALETLVSTFSNDTEGDLLQERVSALESKIEDLNTDIKQTNLLLKEVLRTLKQ